MFKSFFSILIVSLIFCFNALGQGQTGVARYVQIQDTYYDTVKFPNPYTQHYALYFSEKSSNYVNDIDDQRSTNLGSIGFEGKEKKTQIASKQIFRDPKLKMITFSYSKPGLVITYINEPLKTINWQIHSEQRKIGKFNCIRATATFRGRDYEAWFAPEIPLPHGPWKLHGLPGLILEAYDTRREIQFLFESIDIPSASAPEMLVLKREGIETSFEDYKKSPDFFWGEAATRYSMEDLKAKGSSATITIRITPTYDPIELSFED